MLLRRVAIQNVRSFRERAEFISDGMISISIGPNGGGKTNLLDTIVIVLRRFLLASNYPSPQPTPEQPDRHVFQHNDALNGMVLDRHTGGGDLDQIIECEVEVTQRDIENMHRMKNDGPQLRSRAARKYANPPSDSDGWHIEAFTTRQRFVYTIRNGGLENDPTQAGAEFKQYLQTFEADRLLRQEYGFAPLSTPLLYLSVNRSATAFQSRVQLAGYNDYEQKRQSDAVHSRGTASAIPLAVGRLAQKFRLLLELEGSAKQRFEQDDGVREITRQLQDLGYGWTLETVDPIKNIYDIQLTKQGTAFAAASASSGERELLTYVFTIFALNVRDAIIVVDEPELHLHPTWQKKLLDVFGAIATSTGNQFLLATHSPTFISPQSIQFVSRVFSVNQSSQILRLDTSALPDNRHLLSIVNSQNNERLFFADKVVLVEGISDRIFFEAILNIHARESVRTKTIEIISVGGKGLFATYAKLLNACKIEFAIIADLDYVDQIGTGDIKALFRIDESEIGRRQLDLPVVLPHRDSYRRADDN